MKSEIIDLQSLGPDPKKPRPFLQATSTASQASFKMHLRLLATSDLHVNIMPFDYFSGKVTHRLGLARTASLISAARAEAANCVLVDNGDFLQGSTMGDYVAQTEGRADYCIHPMFTAMNHLGYDAGTLGNHEFNYGVDFLLNSLHGAHFPVVSANVYLGQVQEQEHSLVPPYVILTRTVLDTDGKRQSIKIGVIGFTPPQILQWDDHQLAGRLSTKDIVQTAQAYVPQMKGEGADLIIALTHSGIGKAEATQGTDNVCSAVAGIAGIDAIVAGHVHLVFPSDDFAHTADVDPVSGTLCGKPAVMPGQFGSHLGVIDLFLSSDAGVYKVQSHRSEARPIWRREADGSETALVESQTDLVDLVSEVHCETLNWANSPIGSTQRPLHSFFALLAETPAFQLVAAAQALHVKDLLATTAFAHLPVLSSVAPFKCGGRGGPDNYTDVPAGDVMLRNAADLYIYPNTCAGISMTGAEVANWLEYAVGIFNQITPGSSDAPLIDPDFPSFNFDMIFGLQFMIDLSRPAKFDRYGSTINPHSKRIVGLDYNGQTLDPLAKFAVATNSYRMAANSDYLLATEDRLLFTSRKTNQDIVVRYFSQPQTEIAAGNQNRRFAPMPGTTVTFDTSPKALAHLDELDHLALMPLGLMPNGFMRFRLHL